MIEKEFSVNKSNGMIIRGIAYLPDDLDISCPAVIFSHGFDCCYNELKHHGTGFVDNNIACFFFDFCGGGRKTLSSGDMQYMNVLTEAEDLKDVMEYVRTLPYVDKYRLFLAGESMGGFVSAYVSAQISDEVCGLILWYPGFIMPEYFKERQKMGATTVFGIPVSDSFNETAMNIDIYKMIEAYSGPVLIIHGEKDEIVPVSYSEKAALTYPNAVLKVIKNAKHGFEGEDSRFANMLSVDFVLKTIK